MKHLLILFTTIIGLALAHKAHAHQAPYSIAYLDVSPDRVHVQLQIPLPELQLAYGNAIGGDPVTVVKRMGPQLKEYIAAHTHAFTNHDYPWLVVINDLSTTSEEQPASGPPFYELRVNLLLLPQQQEDTRHFYFDYDGVVHQVVNHIIFVAVRNDWGTGRSDSLTADTNPLTIPWLILLSQTSIYPKLHLTT